MIMKQNKIHLTGKKLNMSLIKINRLWVHLMIFNFIFISFINAQIPALDQQKDIVLKGGRIHVGNGQIIESGIIVLSKSKIKYVGTDYKVLNQNEIEIDISNKEVYPGFIAPNSTVGLAEIELVKATMDQQELGAMNPNIRSIIAYNTDSKIIPTLRSNGVLLSQISPVGGVISGQTAIVEMDAWNWEDAAYKSDEGISLNWPNSNFNQGWWGEPQKTSKNDQYEKEILALKNYFDQAKSYATIVNQSEKSLAFESMRGLWNGTKKLYIHVDFAKTIIHSIQFAEKYGIKPIVVGGADSWRITDFLKTHNIPIILNQAHSLPIREDESISQSYKTPYLLSEAGILFCLSMDGFWQQRNLAFQAGQAIAFGLSKEAALSSITYNTAKILGIDQSVGTLEIGKDATLFISEGDALDIKTQNIIKAYIRGKEIDLDNVHKQLYKKYNSKYHPELR